MFIAKILIGAAAVFLMFPSLFRLLQRKPKAIDPLVLIGGAALIALLLGYRI